MWPIFRKEVAVYFLTPFGYVFMGLFLLISGIVFTIYNLAGSRGDLYGMLGALNFVAIVIFPVLTMKLLAEEKKTGTEQLLFTAPVRLAAVALGKYLAALFIFVTTLAATGVFAFFVVALGRSPLGGILGAYLGFALLGAAYIAICLFASALTENQVTAAMAGFGLLAGLMLIGMLANAIPVPFLKDVLQALAILSRYEEFASGALRAGPLVYYLSFAVVFLFLTVRVIENRRQNRAGHQGFLVKANAMIMILALTGIMMMVNLIAGKLPWTYDLTVTKIYTLSDQTQRVLAALQKPVTVVAFGPEGKINQRIRVLLEEYRKAGRGRIRVAYADAEKNPEFARRFDARREGIGNGSIVFASGDRIRRVNQFEVETPSEYGTDFNGEPLFTGAILNVTAPRLRKIYFLEGHQELSPAVELSKLKGRIEGDAAAVAGLNLRRSGAVPGDAAAVISAAPQRDLDGAELIALRDYCGKGGRALFLFDVLGPGSRFANFNLLLKEYDVSIVNNFVAEEDPQSFYANRKNYLVPRYGAHPIVAKLNAANLPVFLPYAGNIQIAAATGPLVRIEPLLQSSAQSWIRADVADSRPDRTAADRPGPANLAVAVTKSNAALKYRETKLVLVYNARFATDKILDVQGNYDFLMNALNWIEDSPEGAAVRPKPLDTGMMFMRDDQKVLLMIFAVFLYPLLPFGAGTWVWLRRRRL